MIHNLSYHEVMKYLIRTLLIFLFTISSAMADIVLKIENDSHFQVILEQMQRDSEEVEIEHYLNSLHYRYDISLEDLVDQVSLITDSEELRDTLSRDMMNFLPWFKKLKQLASQNESLRKKLDRRLSFQLYNLSGLAILPEYKYIDFKKIKQLGLLKRIKRYNKLINVPDINHVTELFRQVPKVDFQTEHLTVAKIKNINTRYYQKIRNNFYKDYAGLIKQQMDSERLDPSHFLLYQKTIIKRKRNNKVLKANLRQYENVPSDYEKIIKYFNILYNKLDKNNLFFYIEKLTGLALPKKHGLYVVTPAYLHFHWEKIKPAIQEYTLDTMVNTDDAEYIYLIRRWYKKNYQQKLSRLEAIEKLDELLESHPEQPWLGAYRADLMTKNGKRIYFDKTFGQKIGLKLKRAWNEIKKPEVIAGYLAGGIVTAISGGNVALGLGTKNLIRKGLEPLRLDTDWKEFIREAPETVLLSLVLGSGFSPGRLMKVIALGASRGGLQSAFTGQDVKLGMMVGAGLNVLSFYLLPEMIANPMVEGTSSSDLTRNAFLELGARNVRSMTHSMLVASLTGEDLGRAALRGAIYATASTALRLWILGIRYNPYKDYGDEAVDQMIENENHFQNEVGRGGHYAIDRQLINDTDYRVGGLWAKLARASITLPGTVIMSDGGFEKLTTMTHEASHLMQQHQSGVFGFYLLRYFPTFLRTGYDGHPDENFLRKVLHHYYSN
jgi:hypothetical protein